RGEVELAALEPQAQALRARVSLAVVRVLELLVRRGRRGEPRGRDGTQVRVAARRQDEAVLGPQAGPCGDGEVAERLDVRAARLAERIEPVRVAPAREELARLGFPTRGPPAPDRGDRCAVVGPDGGLARLVLLPEESHGAKTYRRSGGRETRELNARRG